MSLRILIADDSSTNRLLFTTVMTRLGHAADAASSGREAVDLFAKNFYDLVFLDLNMPLIDGIEAARLIQKINLRGTPVYAMSGYADPEKESLFDAAGIRRCIIKPLDREKIAEAAHECGLDSGTITPAATSASSVPKKLMQTYAHELRSRGNACLLHFKASDKKSLLREAHTIRSLAQMLKTQDVENAAIILELSCRKDTVPELSDCVHNVHDCCIRTAAMLERQPALS